MTVKSAPRTFERPYTDESVAGLTRLLGMQSDGDDADCVHVFCCDEDRALCGADVSGHDWDEEAPDEETCGLCWLAEESGWGCLNPNCGG